MPTMERGHVPLADVVLRDADDHPVPLGELTGVHAAVLMRHRH